MSTVCVRAFVTMLLLGMSPFASADGPTTIMGTDRTPMMLVPAGDFAYGKEQQSIGVPAFYVDQFEVTAQRYDAYLAMTGKSWPKYWEDMSGVLVGNRPVVGVTWQEAVAYCEYQGKRLPTEHEWEKAARGTNGWRYPWGNTSPDDQSANYVEARARAFDHQMLPPINVYHDRLADVGAFPSDQSPYRVFDLAGNVREWTTSDHETQGGKVVRGGSWNSGSQALETVFRIGVNPTAQEPWIGFRCVMSATVNPGHIARSANTQAMPSPKPVLVQPAFELGMQTFYQDPNPRLVTQILIDFNNSRFVQKDSAHPPLIGFLTAIFQQYPRTRMVPVNMLLDRVRYSVAIAYHLAGQHDQAEEVKDRISRRGLKQLDFSKLPSSLATMPVNGPDAYDVLWGASFATGDPQYCLRIVEAFATVANRDGNAEDIVKIVNALVTRADLRWVVDKHGEDQARELAIVSSALWGLESNARQHGFVRTAVDDYISQHSDDPAAKALSAVKSVF